VRNKPRRPHIVERLLEKKAQPAAPAIALDEGHLGNVLLAAKRALPSFDGQDLVNVSTSIAVCQTILVELAKQRAAAAPAAPPAPAAPATPPPPAAETPKG
jgi:hypothetical protein